jgi:hypothetical protein
MVCISCEADNNSIASHCFQCGAELVQSSQKSQMIALILCLFLGFFGVHRAYLGKWFSAVTMFLIGGLFVLAFISVYRSLGRDAIYFFSAIMRSIFVWGPVTVHGGAERIG